MPEWIESSENFNSTYDEETMLNDNEINEIELQRLRSRLAEKDATIQVIKSLSNVSIKTF